MTAAAATVLRDLARRAASQCQADGVLVWEVAGDMLRLVACSGRNSSARRIGDTIPSAPALLARRVLHVRDLARASRRFSNAELDVLGRGGRVRTVAAVPMIRGATAVGLVLLRRRRARAFAPSQIARLQELTAHVAAEIANARLSTDLSEAIERQTVTGEVLHILSRSPTELSRVLDALAEAAARLCNATHAGIFRVERPDLLRSVAQYGTGPSWRVGDTAPLDDGSLSGRAIRTRQPVHVPDLRLATDLPRAQATGAQHQILACVAVPLVAEGAAVGTIIVRRRAAGEFSDHQIELLQTFGDQAAIAIENVRRAEELAVRNRELTEAMRRQTATAETLRVIAGEPGNLERVLDAVARNAAAVCESHDAAIFRVDGDALITAAHFGTIHLPSGAFPLQGATRIYEAVRERRVVHIHDAAVPGAVGLPAFVASQRRSGVRTVLLVPLVRGDSALGVIAVRSLEVRAFTDGQIEALKTYADQAAIAIENARLFDQLEARNRELSETLAEQTATSDVLRIMAQSPTNVQPVFDAIAACAQRVCGGEQGTVQLFDGELIHVAGIANFAGPGVEALRRRFPMPPSRNGASGRTVLTGQVVHVPDVLEDPEWGLSDLSQAIGFRSILSVPMLRDGHVKGLINATREAPGPFSDRQVAMLQMFADQALIAIESVRLFTELESRNQELSETIDQQTATGGILRVMASSLTDVQPVFDAIAEAAMRLCEATLGGVHTFDGELVHVVGTARHDGRKEGAWILYPMPPSRRYATPRAILTASVVHIPDIHEDPEYAEKDRAEARGFRAVLAVPMIRDGRVIGAISANRATPGPFTERHIALIQTLADQAVIAIESVRLFEEVEARNRDLSETLAQQTGTSDVLRVTSESPADPQPVFDTIAKWAMRLCDANESTISLVEGELIQAVSIQGTTPDGIDAIRRLYPLRLGDGGMTTRAIEERMVVQIADVLAIGDQPRREAATAGGYRALLIVPLIRRDGHALGTIGVGRATPGLFAERHVEIIKTFADQAVVALESLRLFKELQASNQELSETLAQQTATSDVLSVMASTMADAQPVLDAIATGMTKLCAGAQCSVQLYDGEFLHVAAVAGFSPGALEAVRAVWPMRPGRHGAGARAVLTGEMVHIPDVLEDPEYGLGELARSRRYRSVLTVPMLREGRVVGVLTTSRTVVGPFSERQIAGMRALADQAVIAIEHVRLFRELSETLEQQTATNHVLGVMASSMTDVQPVFDAIAESAMRLCNGKRASVYTFNGELIHVAGTANYDGEAADTLRRLFPMRPVRHSAGGRAILTGTTAHVPDILDDPEYEMTGLAETLGYRAILVVPMLLEGRVVGSVSTTRAEPGPFSDRQIGVLQTFARQAAIAIEHVRLLKLLDTRNRDLSETLAEQTATNHVLGVMANSMTDAQPVFDAVAESTLRLCNGTRASVYTFDGERIHVVGMANYDTASAEALRRAYPMRPRRRAGTGRAILTGATVHIPDTLDDAEYGRDAVEIFGYRALLSVPMVSEGRVMGAVSTTRTEPGPFSDRQIAVLQTFARQAAIAIEHVRLLKLLDTRNTELSDALDQQTAISGILRVMASSPADTQPVFDAIAETGLRLCDATTVAVLIFDGQRIHPVGVSSRLPGGAQVAGRAHPTRPSRRYATSRAVLTGEIVHMPDIREDPEYKDPLLAEARGFRAVLSVPMVRDGRVSGVITATRSAPGAFSERNVALIRTLADQAAIAIENVSLFKQVQSSNAELSEALAQQTATSDVLRATSASPSDIQPVFDTIAEWAQKLCRADITTVTRVEGDLVHAVSVGGFDAGGVAAVRALFPQRVSVDDGALTTRAIRERAVVQSPDQSILPNLVHRPAARPSEYRALLVVPMIHRDGQVLGTINVGLAAAGVFSDRDIERLKTLADQAVIALENVRLFGEVQARNRDLSEALDQQTATSNVLRVMASAPSDVEPVFRTIAETAVTLCDATYGSVLTYDGELIHLAGVAGDPSWGTGVRGGRFPVPPSRRYASPRAILTGEIVHLADVREDPEYGEADAAAAAGICAILSVPMLRDGRVIGAISANRATPGPFSERHVTLLKTLADQAVIAIENVRLFKELQASNANLSEALAQQTAISDVLRATSASAADVQPVFDAIAEWSLKLCEADFSSVTRFDGELLHLEALRGLPADVAAAIVRAYPVRPGDRSGHTRAVARRAVMHIPDVLDDPAYEIKDTARTSNYRATLVVPMIRDERVLGTIGIGRATPGYFSDRQIEILQMFANQAVVALESVRLFNELQASNREVRDALERQTATAEILGVINRSPTDVQPIFKAIIDNAVRLSAADRGVIFRVEDDLLVPVAEGPDHDEDAWTALQLGYPRAIDTTSMIGRALLERRVIHAPDVEAPDAPERRTPAVSRGARTRSQLTVPMFRGDEPIGAIAVGRHEPGPFSAEQIEVIQILADQMSIALDSVRLFDQLQKSNGEVREALERQTATAEIIRVLSRSHPDVQPVFDTIADTAMRVFRPWSVAVWRYEDGQLHLRAARGGAPGSEAELYRMFPRPATRALMAGRAVLERTVQQRSDYLAEAQDPAAREMARLRGLRAALAVPILRDDEPVGVIMVTHAEPRVFPTGEIEMLETFADEAVIAIENARLFGELQATTNGLSRSVQRLTALGEVGQAVSSTLDLPTVLSTIVAHAIRLSGADAGAIYELDEATDELELRASQDYGDAVAESLRAMPLKRGEGVVGRVIETGEPLQVPDIAAPGAYESRIRDVLVGSGGRTLLAVPILHEGRVVGTLSMIRRVVAEFPAEVVDLLKTFASQSALAIQNARLFRALEEQRSRIEVVSQHKSEFLASMSHEIRTPLNAIIGYSELLLENAVVCAQPRAAGDLQRIHSSGRHLLQLINGVLDISKVEAGRMEVFAEEFSVAVLVDDVAAVVRPLALKNNNTLTMRCAQDVGDMCSDLMKVRQTLLNLLSNACKFTEAGTITIAVARDRADQVDDWIVFEVRDTGIGMTPEQQRGLFRDFSQVEAVSPSRFGGTGLGLALSRRFCRLMGGDIVVESERGRGSTFTVRLPAVLRATKPAGVGE